MVNIIKQEVVIEELRYGKYYILEKEAPEGYILNEEKKYLDIKKKDVFYTNMLLK